MIAAAAVVPLREVETALRDACGITLTAGLRGALAEACLKAAHAVGSDVQRFVARLLARDERALAALVEFSVVQETYFFRHPEQFALLRAALLDRHPRDRPLAIWSAGCATGEEPYSLAMALRDAGRSGSGDRVLGTDVSSRSLAVAREGVYGEWSLRRLDPETRERHFEARPPLVAVRPEVRAAVELRRHNLVRDEPPATGLDLVVCRNVLIYFDGVTATKVAARLVSALAPGGLLLLGPVEVPIAEGLGVERMDLEGATAFRRVERPARAPGPPPAPARRTAGAPRRARAAAPSVPAPPPRSTPAAAPAAPADDAVAASARSGFERAREAARGGDLPAAERIAREAAARELSPEAYLLVSMAAEARGDVAAAVDAVRRALYLDPTLAMAHAALVPLYARLGQDDEAARARRNALRALDGVDDAAELRGVEAITAGALRSALGDSRRDGQEPGGAARGDG
jgi:chemotaxis protein methyltransferase CheR